MFVSADLQLLRIEEQRHLDEWEPLYSNCLMPHNGIFFFRRGLSTRCGARVSSQSRVQLGSSAKALSPSGRGRRSRGLPPQQSNIAWLWAIIPKPPHSLLSPAFIASGSLSSSAAFHFAQTACVDAASWQPLLPVVCMYSCESSC